MEHWLHKKHKNESLSELRTVLHIKKVLLPFSRFAVDKLKITKERVWIHRNEVVDAIELYKESKLEFFSYTYKVLIDDSWVPLVRFDNWEIGPHYDKYDENGSLVAQNQCPKKTLEEVAELAKEFRRNLVTMDIATL